MHLYSVFVAKVLASLFICADWPQFSLIDNAISSRSHELVHIMMYPCPAEKIFCLFHI